MAVGGWRESPPGELDRVRSTLTSPCKRATGHRGTIRVTTVRTSARDDFIEPFDDSFQLFRGNARHPLTESIDGQRSNLTDARP